MLLPVFICDGKDPYRAASWTVYPRLAPYVCSTLYDVRREYPCPAENPGTPRYKNDHALCSSGTGPS
nr:hypothetical protein [Citrobacter sp. Marseille-Q6884]